MRLITKGMDARRGAQRIVVPFASAATPRRKRPWGAPQTPFRGQTGPAMHCAHGVVPQGLPLVVTRRLFGITKPRDSRLALRAMHGRRTFVPY